MTLTELLDAVADGIAGLDASTYAQDDTVDAPTFTRSAQVLDPILQPTQGGHLAFSVLVRTRPIVNQRRGTAGDVLREAVGLEVAFGYRIRPTEQTADYGQAYAAAAAIAALVNDEAAWGASADVTVQVTDLGTPRVALEGGILILSTSYQVHRDQEI